MSWRPTLQWSENNEKYGKTISEVIFMNVIRSNSISNANLWISQLWFYSNTFTFAFFIAVFASSDSFAFSSSSLIRAWWMWFWEFDDPSWIHHHFVQHKVNIFFFFFYFFLLDSAIFAFQDLTLFSFSNRHLEISRP